MPFSLKSFRSLLLLSLVFALGCQRPGGKTTIVSNVDAKGFGGGDQLEALVKKAKAEAELEIQLIVSGADVGTLGDKRYCDTSFVCAMLQTLEGSSAKSTFVIAYLRNPAAMQKLLKAFSSSKIFLTQDASETDGNQAYTEKGEITFLIPRIQNLTLSDLVALQAHEHVHGAGFSGTVNVEPFELEEFANAVGAIIVASRNRRLGMQPVEPAQGTPGRTVVATTPPVTPATTAAAPATPVPVVPPPVVTVETTRVYHTPVDGMGWAYGLLPSLSSPGQVIHQAFNGIRCDQPNAVGVVRWKRPEANVFFYNGGYDVPGWQFLGYEFCVSSVQLQGMEPLYRFQNQYHGSFICTGENCTPPADGLVWTRRSFMYFTYPMPYRT